MLPELHLSDITWCHKTKC